MTAASAPLRARVARRERTPAPPRAAAVWGGVLRWLVAVALLAAVVLPLPGAVADAGWSEALPDLLPVAAVAVAGAALLAALPLHGVFLWPFGIALGIPVVLWRVLSLDLLDQTTSAGARLDDLVARLGDWGDRLVNGQPVLDQLPFVFVMTAGLWLAVMLGTLLALRTGNAWPLLLGVIATLLVAAGEDGSAEWRVGAFVLAAAPLVMWLRLRNRLSEWRAQGRRYSSFVAPASLVITLAGVALLWPLVGQLPDRPVAVPNALDRLFNGEDPAVQIFADVDPPPAAPEPAVPLPSPPAPAQARPQPIDNTPLPQSRIPGSANLTPAQAPPTSNGQETPPAGGAGASWWLLGLLYAGAGSVLAAALARLFWERDMRGRSRAERSWIALSRIAAWSGLRDRPGATPYERARALSRVLGDAAAARLAQDYVAVRFGRRVLAAPREAENRSAWEHVRGGLLRHAVRRRRAALAPPG